MAYDANFPPDHQALNAAPFRTQFTGLKTLIDEKADSGDLVSIIQSQSAGPVTGVDDLMLVPNNPPTNTDVELVIDKINELLAVLRRM
jgi:hypothetical protein